MPTICASRAARARIFGAAAADQERRARSLHRLGHPVEIGDAVVLAVERERAVGEEALQHRDRLGEPRDAHAGPIERDARLLVVGRHPARADAELEPAVGQQVERRHLAREHDGMLVVVAEHERSDAQRVGDAAAMCASATVGARSCSTKWSGTKNVE